MFLFYLETLWLEYGLYLCALLLYDVLDELVEGPEPAAGSAVEGGAADQPEHAASLVLLQGHHQVLVVAPRATVLTPDRSVLHKIMGYSVIQYTLYILCYGRFCNNVLVDFAEYSGRLSTIF